MLSIKLHTLTLPNLPGLSNYGRTITHLASKTVALYRGEALRPLGPAEPSFDISQVCCWVSEQPMNHGMRLCTLRDASGDIKIIAEPSTDAGDDSDTMDIDKTSNPSPIVGIEGVELKDLLLISPDCCEGLRMSLEYFQANQANQALIKNPKSPQTNVTNPLSAEHYIWPTRVYRADGREVVAEHGFVSVDASFYNSHSCFIYSRKNALVQNTVDAVDSESSVSPVPQLTASSSFDEYIFVEANPVLPEPLYVMAQNTIRLFRLNSRFYQHSGQDHHNLAYNTSQNEIYYDDLRLAGRWEAFKRARKSLDQLKHLRHFSLDRETIDLFLSQYKILIELSGYRSIWATVFNDGGDPGGFNDILGVPSPTAPIPSSAPVSPDLKRKRNALPLINLEVVKGALLDYATGEAPMIDDTQFEKNLGEVKNTSDFWEDIPNVPKIKKLKANQEGPFFEKLTFNLGLFDEEKMKIETYPMITVV